ncbi:MAG: carbohydrate ABC transporter permease [Gorillibacterium sp.]|nr:carbohydrate ABC transporter permease [Gorillibacterium sp.]
MKRFSRYPITSEVLAWIFGLLIIIPLLIVLLNSLKDRAGANLMTLSLPKTFHWNNYLIVIKEGRLLQSFFNSLLISTASVFISTLFSSLASFIISRRKSKFNRGIYYYFLVGLIAPLNMVTVIKTLQVFHLMNSYSGIILLYSSLLIPFSIFLYAGFINTVPQELDEAAIIDGCGPGRLFFNVVFPLLKPVTMTVVVINFMNSWNDFITPLYLLNSSEKWTMTLAIYNFYGQRISDWQLVFADIVLTVLPVLFIYMLGQRYIISGMTAGAVKG